MTNTKDSRQAVFFTYDTLTKEADMEWIHRVVGWTYDHWVLVFIIVCVIELFVYINTSNDESK